MPGRGGTEQPQRAEAARAAGALPVVPAARDGGADRTGAAAAPRARTRPEAVPRDAAAAPCDPIRVAVAHGRPDDAAAALLELLGDPGVREVHLTSRPESAAVARRLALGVIGRWGLAHQADTVELLVSELVGNAVRHTGARRVGLRMLRGRGRIRVEVRDPSRALPCLLPIRPLDIGGRGLFLVDHLADRWGADLHARGKTTWFELRAVER